MPAPEQYFIVTPANSTFNFSLEPAHNVYHSLWLLLKAEKLLGLNEWVTRTAARLTPEERQRHRLVMIGFSYAVNPDQSWPSFPAYLDHLATVDPVFLQDKLLNTYVRISALQKDCFDLDDTPISFDKAPILASVDAYLEFLRSRFSAKDIHEELECEAYTYVNDPSAMQDLMVTHLRAMWDKYLAVEWERVRPMLQDAVTAFRQIDFSQMGRLEAAQLVTGQELHEEQWRNSLAQAGHIIFTPSAHVGPYLSRFKAGTSLGILFGARLPEGTHFHAPDLSRAEILVRLSALADDTRLRILKLIAEEGEQRSQDIMYRLELSQSAASRHLQQLSATGYLTERRCEGAKCYALNPERIENTLHAVSAFLIGK